MTNHLPPRLHRWAWMLALLAVTLLAFGLRWYYVAVAQVYKPLSADAGQYFSYAWNLVHHGVFSKALPGAANVIPDNFRDPGYPLFLAALMKWFGIGRFWYFMVLLVQAMLGALTVGCAMLLGRYWLPRGWVLIAGLVMAVWPHSIAIDSFLMSETLFGFLCVLSMLMCARACTSGHASWAVAAGLAFGAASLTNAVLLPFGVLLALFLAWKRLVTRRIWVALALSAMLLPGVWMLRNSRLPTQADAITSMDRAMQNLVQGAWPQYHAAFRTAVLYDTPQAKQVLAAINEEYTLLRTQPVQGARAILARLGKHPWIYLRWYVFEKPALLWGWSIRVGQGDVYVKPTRNSPFVTNAGYRAVEWICHTSNDFLTLLALVGVVLAMMRLRKSERAKLEMTEVVPMAIGLLLVFVTGVYTVLQSEPRYSIPFRSFEILMIATACWKTGRWIMRSLKGGRSLVSGSSGQGETTVAESGPAPARGAELGHSVAMRTHWLTVPRMSMPVSVAKPA